MFRNLPKCNRKGQSTKCSHKHRSGRTIQRQPSLTHVPWKCDIQLKLLKQFSDVFVFELQKLVTSVTEKVVLNDMEFGQQFASREFVSSYGFEHRTSI